MTTKVDKLRAEAEKARRLAEEAEAEAAREAEAEAARREVIEREWYDAHEEEYYAAPQVITAARERFVEAALTGDLQVAFAAWMEWQRVWSEQAAWVTLLHHKLFSSRGVQRTRGQAVYSIPHDIASGALVAQRSGISDFSEDLKNALRGALKDEAGAAYIKERTAELTKALKG